MTGRKYVEFVGTGEPMQPHLLNNPTMITIMEEGFLGNISLVDTGFVEAPSDVPKY